MITFVVVILGGSGFIGRELCEKWRPETPSEQTQKQQSQQTKIFTINRGNVYWGKPLNAPMIHSQIKGNRRSQESMNSAFEEIVSIVTTENDNALLLDSQLELHQHHDLRFIIIDFSSDDADDIVRTQQSLHHISQKYSTFSTIKMSLVRYILISTDSVYDDDDDNNIKQIRDNPTTWRVSETNFRLRKLIPCPSADDQKSGKFTRRQLKEALSYSTRKRRIEDCIFSSQLLSNSNQQHHPHQDDATTIINSPNNMNIVHDRITSLRMADVIGAFDDTNRFWATQLWCEYVVKRAFVGAENSANNFDKIFEDQIPIDSAEANRLISFTASWDMLNVIWKLVDFAKSMEMMTAKNDAGEASSTPIRAVRENEFCDFHQDQSRENAVKNTSYIDRQQASISGAFNVACVEPISVKDFVKKIFDFVVENYQLSRKKNSTVQEDAAATSSSIDSDGKRDSSAESSSSSSTSSSSSSDDDEDATCDFYPSVSCGPLNVEKAMRCISWSPMNLSDAITRTCGFFAKPELRKLKDEFRKGAVRKLPTRKMRNSFLSLI